MKKGSSFGVSVGPGQGTLITMEAADIIRSADIIFLPSSPKEDCRAYNIIRQIMPEIDDKDLRCEAFTMSRNSEVMVNRHDEIFSNICPLLDEGRNIVFLALGEVALYSTYLYIHERLLRAGYSSVLISGISSVQAVCARLGLAIAMGREEVHIFPDTEDLINRLGYSGTRIFMKPKGDLETVTAAIREYTDSHKGLTACGISNCGMAGEIIARNSEELDQLSGYFTVIIVRSQIIV